MKATRICATKNGVLYLDEHYQTWIFKLENGKFLPLEKGTAIHEFIAKKGFVDTDKDTLSMIISIVMSDLLGINNYKDKKVHLNIHILEHVEVGLDYYAVENDMPWYDNVLIHPCLVYMKHSGPDIINDIRYDSEGMYLFIEESADTLTLREVEPLTDEEIGALKSGPIAEDPEWFLKIDKKILCYASSDGEPVERYLWFIDNYNSEDQTYLEVGTTDDGFKYAKPLSDRQLDSFKIGL